MGKQVADLLAGVLDGRVGFEDLARGGRRTWRSLAEYLARRWRPPSWVSPEDVEQDILFGAWRAVWEWDPRRGTTLERYVIFNACSYAKRELHRARGAILHGCPDKAPSRFEAPVDLDDPEIACHLRTEPNQEARILREEERAGALAEAMRYARPEERAVLEAISRADSVSGGGLALYDDVEYRRRTRWCSEADAEAHARRVAESVAERMATEDRSSVARVA